MSAIRPANPGDYAQIATLCGDAEELFLAFPAARWPLDRRQLHRLAEVRSDLTVAVTGETVSGFANLYGHTEDRAYIGNLVVRHAQRGQGVGRLLLEYMLALAFDTYGLRQARLSVFSDNRPALDLYRGFGFTPFDRDTRDGPDGRPRTLLHLQLARGSCETG